MSCDLPAGEIRKLKREFTELHEGLAPDSISCEHYQGPKPPIRQNGRVVQIDYDKIIPSGLQWYYHPIAVKSSPKIGFDSNGIPVIYAGKIHVTTRGIEDFKPDEQTREHVPGKPRSLTVFGRLRQIRYKPESEPRVLVWKPSDHLALAHDERGELHIFKERANKEVKKMAKKHRRGSHRRRNPSLKEIGKDTVPLLIVGASGVAIGGVVNHFLSKPKDSTLPASAANPPRLSGYKRAVAELGIGIALAAAAKAFKQKDLVAFAAGIGPTFYGIGSGVEEFNAQKAANTAPQMPAYTTGGPTAGLTGGNTGAAPGQGAMRQGGIPAGYYAVPRQSCGVR